MTSTCSEKLICIFIEVNLILLSQWYKPYCLCTNLDLPLHLTAFSPQSQSQSWQLLSVYSKIISSPHLWFPMSMYWVNMIWHTSLFLFFLCGQGIRSRNLLILGRDNLAKICLVSSTLSSVSPGSVATPLRVGSKSTPNDKRSTTLTCLFSWAIWMAVLPFYRVIIVIMHSRGLSLIAIHFSAQ